MLKNSSPPILKYPEKNLKLSKILNLKLYLKYQEWRVLVVYSTQVGSISLHNYVNIISNDLMTTLPYSDRMAALFFIFLLYFLYLYIRILFIYSGLLIKYHESLSDVPYVVSRRKNLKREDPLQVPVILLQFCSWVEYSVPHGTVM
jgi:hypothetical protein